MVLSYLLFCDGPANGQSWRPNDDEGMWHARRDALVRIVNSALYAVPNVTEQIHLVFPEYDETQSGDVCRKISTATLKASFTSHVVIPTEKALMKVLRKGFLTAESSSLSKSVDDHLVVTLDPDPAELHLGNGNQEVNVADNKSIDSYDKRKLLHLMQQHCTKEFLKQQQLSGSEELVLKKKNKKFILDAYELWKKGIGNQVNVKNDENNDFDYDEFSNVKRHFSLDEKLVSTFRKLLLQTFSSACKKLGYDESAIIRKAKKKLGYIATVLLLHEDYPLELPIFGDVKDKDSMKSSKICICALGAVRDMSQVEVHSLLYAAHTLRMCCVGANLGRTAEFTSKIISALNIHALSGRLKSAIDILRGLKSPTNSFEMKKLHGLLNDLTSDSSLFNKLVPVRSGGWSWDGRKNKKRKIMEVMNQGTDENLVVCDSEYLEQNTSPKMPANATRVLVHNINVAVWLSLLPANICTDISRRESLHGLVQLIVSTLWRSRLGSEVSRHEEQNLDRTKVKPTLYLIFEDNSVAHITQNHVAEFISKEHRAAPSEFQVLFMLEQLLHGSKHNSAKTKESTSILVDYSQIVDITNQNLEGGHITANERVLLYIFLRITDAKDNLESNINLGCKRSKKVKLRVVKLNDTLNILGSQQSTLYDAKSYTKSAPPISECAYKTKCTCEEYKKCSPQNEESYYSTQQYLFVLPNLGVESNNVFGETVCRSLYWCKSSRKIASKGKNQKKVKDKDGMVEKINIGAGKMSKYYSARNLISSSSCEHPRISAATAITTLQHYAYHDRLHPCF